MKHLILMSCSHSSKNQIDLHLLKMLYSMENLFQYYTLVEYIKKKQNLI